MKTTKMTLFLSTLALLLSCGEKPQTDPSPEVKFSVSKTEFVFEAKGGEDTFTVTAGQKPLFVGRYDWCTLTSSALENGSMTVSLKVDSNDSQQQRNADYSVVCGNEKIKLYVSQKASEGSGDTPAVPSDFLTEPSLADNAALSFTRKLGYGWNLGNQLDAYSNGVSNETCWGNKQCTQATFNSLKDKGFSTVRIPVTWMGHVGDAPEYKIEEAWLNRVVEVALYAKTAGLNAIVNIHHDDSPDSGWLLVGSASNQNAKAEILARFAAMWKQIAERFADEGDWLIFEGYNELQDGGWGWGGNLNDGGRQYAFLNELANTFVSTVRATGGKNADRYLGVLGYSANPDLTIENLVLPKDNVEGRLLVSVHFYDPSGYALGQNADYTEWGHNGTAGKKDPNHDEASVISTFKKLKEKYMDNNIPLYIGECGAVNRTGARAKAFQKYWFEFVFKAAKAYGLSPVIWDNGAISTGNESFGFLNHSDGGYINDSKPVLDAVRKAYTTDTESYTLRSVYNSSPNRQ